MKKPFYSTSFQELEDDLISQSLPKSGATLLYRWHFKKRKQEMLVKDLANKTQKYIEENYHFDIPEIVQVHESSDQTIKLLIKFFDNLTVEAVLIPFHNKYTLCLSTQVGCAMNCSFCFTGTQGLKRHLTCEEIIGQFIVATNFLEELRKDEEIKKPLKNIVFMGQGEPLHNFDHVKKACEIFLEENGICLGIQKITVSTAGYLPGIKRWLDEMPRVNIALSLHSAIEEKRNELIPINKKYPLDEVIHYIQNIPLGRKQYVIYEYLLTKDFNDSEEDAHEVGKLLSGSQSIINLIPFNPYPNAKYLRPTDEKVLQFKNILDSYKLPALIRGTKGDDILAACGQLNTKNKTT
jgi:23S rRNA (adenine2503-C2)-methyltransferase